MEGKQSQATCERKEYPFKKTPFRSLRGVIRHEVIHPKAVFGNSYVGINRRNDKKAWYIWVEQLFELYGSVEDVVDSTAVGI